MKEIVASYESLPNNLKRTATHYQKGGQNFPVGVMPLRDIPILLKLVSLHVSHHFIVLVSVLGIIVFPIFKQFRLSKDPIFNKISLSNRKENSM